MGPGQSICMNWTYGTFLGCLAFCCIERLIFTFVGNTWPIPAGALSSLLGYLQWFRAFLLWHLTNITRLTLLLHGERTQPSTEFNSQGTFSDKFGLFNTSAGIL